MDKYLRKKEKAEQRPREEALKNRFGSSKELRIETEDFLENDIKYWGPLTDPGKSKTLTKTNSRYTPDSTTGKKRRRRKAAQIDRTFCCSFPGCGKAYGAEGSLNQHTRLKHRDTRNTGKKAAPFMANPNASLLHGLYGISPGTLPYLQAAPALYTGSYPDLLKRAHDESENIIKRRSWSCSAVDQSPILSISPANMAFSSMSLGDPCKESAFDFSFVDSLNNMDNNSLKIDNKLALMDDTDDSQTEPADWDDTFIDYHSESPTIDELLHNLSALDDKHNTAMRYDESNNQLEHDGDDSLLDSMLLNSNLKYQPLDADELPPMESEILNYVNPEIIN